MWRCRTWVWRCRWRCHRGSENIAGDIAICSDGVASDIRTSSRAGPNTSPATSPRYQATSQATLPPTFPTSLATSPQVVAMSLATCRAHPWEHPASFPHHREGRGNTTLCKSSTFHTTGLRKSSSLLPSPRAPPVVWNLELFKQTIFKCRIQVARGEGGGAEGGGGGGGGAGVLTSRNNSSSLRSPPAPPPCGVESGAIT